MTTQSSRRDVGKEDKKFNGLRVAGEIAHPFARYGLAVALALHANGKPLSALSEGELREALAKTIEDGLNTFRMETKDDPKYQEKLRFRSIPLDDLRANSALISGSLAAQGKYLYPSVVATDRQVKGTFADSEIVLACLRDNEHALSRPMDLKRSIAPICGEINNGGKEKINQKGSLFAAACLTAATLAPQKPASRAEARAKGAFNTSIFPGLDIAELVEFVKVFRRFQAEGQDLLIGKPTKTKKYKRPPLVNGNYPGAPHEAAFGAIGLLAAIGYWANRAEETTRAQTLSVLGSLQNTPLYMISYGDFAQARYSNHVINLAKTGDLRDILNDYYWRAVLYSGLEHGVPVHFASPGNDAKSQELMALSIAYKHFYLMTSRFLQQFNENSLRGLLSLRAEYPPSFKVLLEVYFMQAEHKPIPREIVESARALGQWINRTAYLVAEEDIEKETDNRPAAVRKAKAKVLVEFESAVMSAESPADMLHRVSTRAGRLLQSDAPSEATPYFDATASEDPISFKTAQHLLIAYLRLRATPMRDASDSNAADAADANDNDTDLIDPEAQP